MTSLACLLQLRPTDGRKKTATTCSNIGSNGMTVWWFFFALCLKYKQLSGKEKRHKTERRVKKKTAEGRVLALQSLDVFQADLVLELLG